MKTFFDEHLHDSIILCIYNQYERITKSGGSLVTIYWGLVCTHISPRFDSSLETKLSLLGKFGFGLRLKWFTWCSITDDQSTLWHQSESIPNSGQTVQYDFGLIHSVALSAFPTRSADRIYQKNKNNNMPLFLAFFVMILS